MVPCRRRSGWHSKENLRPQLLASKTPLAELWRHLAAHARIGSQITQRASLPRAQTPPVHGSYLMNVS
jgi:hypothetical protein